MSASRQLQRRFQSRKVPDDWKTLQRNLGVSPIIARILASRGISSRSDCDLQLAQILPPDGLAGIQNAAARLVHAIQDDERILIAGDFDADGATASALCVSALSEFGAKNVEFAVPNRFHFGYGLTKPFVETLLERKPQVIVTVDNGISSNEGISFARENGIDVIVTDHHLPPEELPVANVIVNPQLSHNSFPSSPAGVGVAFYLIAELRRQLRDVSHFSSHGLAEPNMASYLDLVALGTIVDLVPLDQNNRAMVHNGLNLVRRGRARPGLKALCEASKVNPQNINEEDLGFRLGPRINAAGRLEDISVGIQALTTTDIQVARSCVSRLDAINTERKEIQTEMTEVAMSYLDSIVPDGRTGICLYESGFHEGVVGLVANQVVTRLNRPSVVFANANDGGSGFLKGSARSISSVHIRDVLADIDASHPNLIKSYGGHAMAAGLTIHRGSFERFGNLFDAAVADRAPEGAFDTTLYTDGELEAAEISMDLVREIEAWGPWGQYFDRPMFHGKFQVISERLVGNDKHAKMVVQSGGKVIDAIAFNQQLANAPQVELAFRPTANSYGGVTTLQLVVESLRSIHS